MSCVFLSQGAVVSVNFGQEAGSLLDTDSYTLSFTEVSNILFNNVSSFNTEGLKRLQNVPDKIKFTVQISYQLLPVLVNPL